MVMDRKKDIIYADEAQWTAGIRTVKYTISCTYVYPNSSLYCYIPRLTGRAISKKLIQCDVQIDCPDVGGVYRAPYYTHIHSISFCNL